MPWYGKDADPAGATNASANFCRNHPLPADTIIESSPELTGMRFYSGTKTPDGDARMAVYRLGSLTDPSASVMLQEHLFEFEGLSAEQWEEHTFTGISIDPTEIHWVAFKTAGGVDIRFDTGGGEEDWYAGAGRYHSSVISADPSIAFAATWPTDSGSQSSFWYYYGLEITAGAPPSPAITEVDHDKLFPLCPDPSIVGTTFNASQSTSRAYLSPSATWVLADALELEVVSWADTLVVVKIGSLEPVGGGNRFIHIVHTPTGTPDPSNGFAVVADYPDHLLQVKKLTSPTTNGVVSVTFDKTPRIVKIMGVDLAADGGDSDSHIHFGVLTADGFRASGMFSNSFITPDFSRHQSDATWIHYDTNGAVAERATPSISGKDVELDFTTTISSELQIYLIAICSDTDLIDVDIGNTTVTSGAVASTSFEPDTVWMGAIGLATYPSEATTHALMSLCVATQDDVAGMHCYWGSTNTAASSLIDSTTILSELVQGSYVWQMTAFTFEADGFSWTGSNVDEFWWVAFRLNGVRCSSAVVTVPDGTAPFDADLHDFGWVAGGMISMSASEPSQNEANGNGGRMSFGFNDGDEALANHVHSDAGSIGSARSQNSDAADGYILTGGDDAESPTWRIELHQNGGPMVRENIKVNVAVNDDANDRVLVWAMESVNKYDSGPGLPL